MASTEKTCLAPDCGVVFVGRPNRVYCSDQCRWSHAAVKKAKDPERVLMGRSNRRKGANAERDVCHVINEITGEGVKRNLSQTRDAGSDVVWGPFMLEVKYQKALALPAWQRQVQVAADDAGLVPAVVYRRPDEKFWISLPFETFVMLFDALRKAAEANQT